MANEERCDCPSCGRPVRVIARNWPISNVYEPIEEKPLAVVEGWLDSADLVVAENGVTTLFISECEDHQIGAMLPVTVTITKR